MRSLVTLAVVPLSFASWAGVQEERRTRSVLLNGKW